MSESLYVSKDCAERGCSCYDDRVDGKPVEYVLKRETRDVMDSDGENRAIRAFLMLYGHYGLTVGQMKSHLTRCGYPIWPMWVDTEHEESHLTKAGAQLWIRYMIEVE